MVDVEYRVVENASISERDRAILWELFSGSYREADEGYLERGLGLYGFSCIAEVGGEPAGFAFGDVKVVDLPRLPGQVVGFPGLCVVAAAYRRLGVLGEVQRRAGEARRGIPEGGRRLSLTRLGHPVGYHMVLKSPTAVPRPGVTPTRWQQEVGAALAKMVGVADFDAERFICRGRGKPIGYPDVEVDATEEEWTPFKGLDRSKGDQLMALSWSPDAPPGWLDD